jgi:hypothetical protein
LPGAKGGGGSIFWKTRDIGLPSYSNNLSTVKGYVCTHAVGNGIVLYIKVQGTGTKFLISKFLITKFLIKNFLITKFLSNKVPNALNS